MNQQATVRQIEIRAKRALSSMPEVCEKAGVALSTFRRWKKTLGNPTPTSITVSTLEKIENALVEIEREERHAFPESGKAVAA